MNTHFDFCQGIVTAKPTLSKKMLYTYCLFSFFTDIFALYDTSFPVPGSSDCRE